jgi:SAM-dependent methyltransferase
MNKNYEKVRNFLVHNLIRESNLYFGQHNLRWLNYTADAWMNDKSNSRWRYELIKEFFNIDRDSKILDMASGCGTFVFYGLLNGYDVYGIEPEKWKNKFNKMKIRLYSYPESWDGRFIEAFGEALPFKDESFDVVSSYQTLEHVSNVKACVKEMLRVVRRGGGGCIFLHFPDYRSTFEAHYLLPWIPLFPKPLARVYLRLLGRPLIGLDTINYVTKNNILRLLRTQSAQVEVTDLEGIIFHRRTEKIIKKFNLKKIGRIGKISAVMINLIYTYLYTPIKRIFRHEKSVTILVRKL